MTAPIQGSKWQGTAQLAIIEGNKGKIIETKNGTICGRPNHDGTWSGTASRFSSEGQIIDALIEKGLLAPGCNYTITKGYGGYTISIAPAKTEPKTPIDTPPKTPTCADDDLACSFNGVEGPKGSAPSDSISVSPEAAEDIAAAQRVGQMVKDKATATSKIYTIKSKNPIFGQIKVYIKVGGNGTVEKVRITNSTSNPVPEDFSTTLRDVLSQMQFPAKAIEVNVPISFQ